MYEDDSSDGSDDSNTIFSTDWVFRDEMKLDIEERGYFNYKIE